VTNSDLLETYLHLQDGIIADRLLTLSSPEAIITFCKADEATYWNFALVKKVLSEQEIDLLEQAFVKLRRPPSIYFENKPSFSPLQKLLIKKNYQISFQESWMFYEQKSFVLPTDYQVKDVSNEEDMTLFLELFRRCYQKDDPQNSYGEIGEGYIKQLKKAWERYHGSQRLEYFIFYKNNDPVAISTLINYKNAGYISNVGSIPQVRGQGFGKLATLHCVRRSQELNHGYHFLATEKKSFLQKFYERMGFTTKFTTIDYVKE
jgi:ribosomal protein S18 acetylase RimI-like enzyme